MDTASAWIKQEIEQHRGQVIAEYYSELDRLAEEKLWHQLMIKLEEVVGLDVWRGANAADLKGLYLHFIAHCADRLNPLKLALVSVQIAHHHQDADSAVAFLEEISKKVASNTEALIVARSTQARFKLDSAQPQECKKMVDDAKALLDEIPAAESSVYNALYDAATAFHAKYGPPAEFYKSGLLYLAYTPLENLALPRQQNFAFALCVAALVGNKVYSFGELLSQPILESLNGSDREWIVRVLQAFNAGDIRLYEQLQIQYKDQLNSEPTLVENIRVLHEKISVLALMELVFKRPSEDRTVEFSVIAEHTRLPLDEVELLLMKAISLKLVKGEIDQVNQEVNFTWVQPRVLDIEKVRGLAARLTHWRSKVRDTAISVETQTYELLV